MDLLPMHQFKTSDGAQLEYFDTGEGQPIIFIAGYRASAQTWLPQVRHYQSKYRVIGLERRFNGNTISPLHNKTIFRQGQDLHDLITYLNLIQPIVVGHSMGGSTVMAYLALFGDTNLKAFVNVDQTPKMVNAQDWHAGMYDLNMANMGTYFDNPLASPFYKTPTPELLQIMKTVAAQTDDSKYTLQLTKPLLLSHAWADWRGILENVTIPTLFMAADHSPFWPSEHATLAANLMKNGSAVILKDVGHGMEYEDPQQFEAALDEFLNSVAKWK
ncbi:alpha/beta fold hydrolase [Paucilactobacillus wasatchensis]|uniref:Halo peroxidase n=1 Tax=Paucilactobacillus wasatchensis TaxID=1335616 RepID=A0A0D1AAW5_9LACO|nr:alpha/beta hydrolase [Paucilactobacillus wasatchensis]KIS03866.1 halo peroxidase [Paucilactobacillus wasatchensis]